MTIDKNYLRKSFKLIRSSVAEKKEKSLAVSLKIRSDIAYQKAECVALFKSFGDEIDTSFIIEAAIADSKEVLLPRICGKEMKFYKYSPDDELEISRFGVEEPIADRNKYVSEEKADLIIIPGLCFDTQKNRLGYGGGFYDRLLSKSGAENIAICFDEQILENELLPVCPKDIKVKKIFTDKRTIE